MPDLAARLTAWDDYVRGVLALQADLGDPDTDPAAPPFQALAEPPPRHILAAAAELSATPAILWDIAGLRERMNRLSRFTGGHRIGLNVAVKACRTVGVLAILAQAGLGADVASPAEWDAARRAGFRRISATGPGFRKQDIARLLDAGVLFDAQSPAQLTQTMECGAPDGIGLRLRVPLPDSLRSATSRGTESRFGVPVNRCLADRLATATAHAAVTRLRVHTGEATARTLEFRTRYALLVAGLLGHVAEINLGGGLLRLSRDPSALQESLATAGRAIEAAGRPRPRCWVEPGAALLLDSGYLVTEVLDVHDDEQHPALTVDVSAWNIAPWTYPSFYPASGEPHRYAGTVFGPTLYEKDRFHPDSSAAAGGSQPAVGDRIVGTSFGAYTTSNGRCFAGLALPAQYAVTPDGLEVISG